MRRIAAHALLGLALLHSLHQARARHSDFVVSVAILTRPADREPPPSASRRGLELFVASIRNSAPSANIVLVADDHNWLRLPPVLRDDPKVHRFTVSEVIAALPGAHVPAVWRNTNLIFGRYFLYPGVLELIRRRFGLNVPLLEVTNTSASCRSHLDDPFVFLSDSGDVIFQRDPFDRFREMLRSRSAATHSGCGQLPPLLVAEEPSQFPVLENGINSQWLSTCFRHEDVVHLEHAPITCAGTTMGSWTAMATYARAMVKLLPYCLTAQKNSAGIDQSTHIMALSARGYAHVRRSAALTATSSSSSGVEIADSSSGVEGNDAITGDDGGISLSRSSRSPNDADDGIRAFLTTAIAELLDLVEVHRTPHDDGLVCTVGLILMSQQSLVLSMPHSSAEVEILPLEGGPVCAVVHQYNRHALPIMLAEVRFLGRPRDFEYCQELPREGNSSARGDSAAAQQQLQVEARDVQPEKQPLRQQRQQQRNSTVIAKQCWTYDSLQHGDGPYER